MKNKIKQRLILLAIFGPLILGAVCLNNPTLTIGSISSRYLFITIIVICYSLIFLAFMFSDKSIPPKQQDKKSCENCIHYVEKYEYWDNPSCKIGKIPDCPDNNYSHHKRKYIEKSERMKDMNKTQKIKKKENNGVL